MGQNTYPRITEHSGIADSTSCCILCGPSEELIVDIIPGMMELVWILFQERWSSNFN
jgi:hypothetical protein